MTGLRGAGTLLGALQARSRGRAGAGSAGSVSDGEESVWQELAAALSEAGAETRVGEAGGAAEVAAALAELKEQLQAQMRWVAVAAWTAEGLERTKDASAFPLRVCLSLCTAVRTSGCGRTCVSSGSTTTGPCRRSWPRWCGGRSRKRHGEWWGE